MTLQNNCEDAFAYAVLPHSKELFGQARKLTVQLADAEDLLQDTLLRAFQSFGSYRQGSNSRAWLYRIMANANIDRCRAKARRLQEVVLDRPLDDERVVAAGLPRRSGSSVEEEAMGALPTWCDRLLRALPDDVRVAVFYIDIFGYTNVQTADILGIPVGTVGSRLHRGRSQLREQLEAKLVDERYAIPWLPRP